MTHLIGEPMVDARQATTALRMPYYWFSDHRMRARFEIPHYVMGGLVRFRLSELTAWAASHVAQARNEQQGAQS